jgi:hypothetical protein
MSLDKKVDARNFINKPPLFLYVNNCGASSRI